MGVLICLVIWMIYLNFTQMIHHINADIVNEITYKKQVWETKNLLPPNWINPHELHTNRLVFIFVPIYAFTKNVMLSHQLTVIIGMLLQLFSLVYLLRQLHMNKTSILFTLCLYLGFNAQSGLLFAYFDAYSGFAIVIFITLGIKLNLDQKLDYSLKNKIVSFQTIILLIMSVYMGYGTPKLIIMLYGPLFIVDVFIYMRKHLLNKEMVWDNNIFSIILSGFLLISNGLSYMVLIKVGANFNPIPMKVVPLSQQLSWDCISTQIQSLLRSLGFYESSTILSKQGILYLLSIIFILSILSSTIYLIKFSKNEIYKKIGFYFIATTGMMFFYLILSGVSDMTYRYFLATTIVSFVVLGICVYDVIKNRLWWTNGIIILLFILILFSLKIAPFDDILPGAIKDEEGLAKCVQYMKNNGYTLATAQYWNAGLLKGYSNWEIQTQQYMTLGDKTPFLWLTDKSIYDEEYDKEPNILFLTDVEEQSALENDNTKFIISENEKVAEFGIYNLYLLERSLFNSIRLPMTVGETKEYNFEDWKYTLYNSSYQNYSKSILSGPNYGGFYGPYININYGSFDITLEYKVHQSTGDDIGVFEITESVSTIVASTKIKETTNKCVLKDVSFNNSQDVEVKGFSNDGNVIEFIKIIFTRVK
jgi:hypothetical protein